MGDVTGFGLEQEEEIAVFLGLLIVWEKSLLGIGRIVEVAGDFVLLALRKPRAFTWSGNPTSSSAMRF